MARDVFSVMHFPMLCGVIAVAAGTEIALAHPGETLELSVRAALGIGAVLFVGGTAAAIWRATGRMLAWRLVIAPAAAAAVVAAGGRPWLAMTALLAMLVTLAVVEAPQGRADLLGPPPA